jgi:hypothetical protein
MLARGDLVAHVIALGRAMRKRGMDEHVRVLKAYYLALKHGLTTGRHNLEIRWDEEHVIEWMKILRLAPHEKDYELRPRGSRCDRCRSGGKASDVHTESTFPGGSKMKCYACQAVWLERDR